MRKSISDFELYEEYAANTITSHNTFLKTRDSLVISQTRLKRTGSPKNMHISCNNSHINEPSLENENKQNTASKTIRVFPQSFMKKTEAEMRNLISTREAMIANSEKKEDWLDQHKEKAIDFMSTYIKQSDKKKTLKSTYVQRLIEKPKEIDSSARSMPFTPEILNKAIRISEKKSLNVTPQETPSKITIVQEVNSVFINKLYSSRPDNSLKVNEVISEIEYSIFDKKVCKNYNRTSLCSANDEIKSFKLPKIIVKDYQSESFEVAIMQTPKKNEVTSPSYKVAVIQLQEELGKKENENRKLSNTISAIKSELKQAEIQRQHLHKYIEALRGNIRVFLRIKKEINHIPQILNIWTSDEIRSNNSIESVSLVSKSGLSTPNAYSIDSMANSYHFSRVFSQNTGQNDIFEEIKPLIISALDGENVCLFAYGATGSGKTYTMQGKSHLQETSNFDRLDESAGVLPRTAILMFDEFNRRLKLSEKYRMSISAIEIYNETIYDLLEGGNMEHEKEFDLASNHSKKTLKSFVSKDIEEKKQAASKKIKSSSQKSLNSVNSLASSKDQHKKLNKNQSQTRNNSQSSNRIQNVKPLTKVSNNQREKRQIINNTVQGIVWKSIRSKDDIVRFIHKAGETRTTESTKFNSESSRSHAVYQLKIEKEAGIGGKNQISYINIIDLAGSEKCQTTNTTGKSHDEIEKMKKTQNEASHINKSLTTLGRIIKILSDKSGAIPPYRESKLTMLLQNSLNSVSKTALIVTVSDCLENYNQTKDSLNFAKTAMTAF